MRSIYLALVFLVGSGPVYANKYVLIKFDAVDGCPESTRLIKKGGANKARCEQGGRKQSDAVCPEDGENVYFKAVPKKAFTITDLPTAHFEPKDTPSSDPLSSQFPYMVVIRGTPLAKDYKYAVKATAVACDLDPRIVIGNAR